MLNEQKQADIKAYNPTDAEREFALKWYKAFTEDKLLKDQTYRCLGNTTLFRFWQVCHDNYNVILPLKSKSDWKRQAKRPLTRDKADGFINKFAKKIISPDVLAQNKNQQIDVTCSRIFGVLLQWWERRMKAVRIYIDTVKKCVIEGTVHVQVHVYNGCEEREVVKNEEIFIPNFEQPVLQKQSHLIRSQITTYEEAKAIFGDYEKWQYVIAGNSDKWAMRSDYINNDYESGIDRDDEVQIIYLWEHTGYDKQGKPKPKKYNVLINGVIFFDVNNESVFRHNLYPMVKTVFSKFANLNFYWGNSLPNKIKHEQEYADALRTIFYNKEILNLLPALMNKGTEHIDQDVVVPAKITPTQLSKDDIFVVPGTNTPITMADINIEQLVERSIDESTQPPVSLGQDAPGGSRTLGEIQLKDYRASELLEDFGNMASFLVEDLAEISLSNIIQFEIKKNILNLVEGSELLFSKLLEIPDQRLSSGELGTLALNFSPAGSQPNEYDILREEVKAKEKGINIEIIYVDPSYFEQLDKLIYVTANPAEKPSKLAEQLTRVDLYDRVYRNNPYANQIEALRSVVNVFGDDESKMIQMPVQEPTEEEMPRSSPSGLAPMVERVKKSAKPKQRVEIPNI